MCVNLYKNKQFVNNYKKVSVKTFLRWLLRLQGYGLPCLRGYGNKAKLCKLTYKQAKLLQSKSIMFIQAFINKPCKIFNYFGSRYAYVYTYLNHAFL